MSDANQVQPLKHSGLSKRATAALAVAGVALLLGGVVVGQSMPMSRAAAQATAPQVTAATNPTAAPTGSVAAVAQMVGPAVVSVRTDQGLGSGVIYDVGGLILTNTPGP